MRQMVGRAKMNNWNQLGHVVKTWVWENKQILIGVSKTKEKTIGEIGGLPVILNMVDGTVWVETFEKQHS